MNNLNSQKLNRLNSIYKDFSNFKGYFRYTRANIATTPLNNAQPWWLFYACKIKGFCSLLLKSVFEKDQWRLAMGIPENWREHPVWQ